MSAASSTTISADSAGGSALQKSEGVWAAAWRRFRADRVGLVSLCIVAAFLVLILLSSLGLVAKKLADRSGRAQRPAHLHGPGCAAGGGRD